jgi:hypothetical protein
MQNINKEGYPMEMCKYQPGVDDFVFVPPLYEQHPETVTYDHADFRKFCCHCKLKPCITVGYAGEAYDATDHMRFFDGPIHFGKLDMRDAVGDFLNRAHGKLFDRQVSYRSLGLPCVNAWLEKTFPLSPREKYFYGFSNNLEDSGFPYHTYWFHRHDSAMDRIKAHLSVTWEEKHVMWEMQPIKSKLRNDKVPIVIVANKSQMLNDKMPDTQEKDDANELMPSDEISDDEYAIMKARFWSGWSYCDEAEWEMMYTFLSQKHVNEDGYPMNMCVYRPTEFEIDSNWQPIPMPDKLEFVPPLYGRGKPAVCCPHCRLAPCITEEYAYEAGLVGAEIWDRPYKCKWDLRNAVSDFFNRTYGRLLDIPVPYRSYGLECVSLFNDKHLFFTLPERLKFGLGYPRRYVPIQY